MSWIVSEKPWEHSKFIKQIPQEQTFFSNIQVSTTCPPIDISGNLYELKTIIEKLDESHEWEYLKKCSNPYELVYSQSHDVRILKSITSLKPLSRSFFKMTEMFFILSFFKRLDTKNIESAHVCEGPGGFIESLFYEAKKHAIKVKSYAMTLKPTKANIPGWKRANIFLKTHPTVSIHYGKDGTGNILNSQNQVSFLKETAGKCNLFTADGGFDFSEHYTTQEHDVFPLLVSSALLGLQTLKEGGDLILKVFDIEQKCTFDFVCLLAFCFDEWTLYKPALSRPCNAEKYFLGKGFKTIPKWILTTLLELRDLEKNKFCISILSHIPDEIKEPMKQFIQQYTENQIHSLKYAIEHKEQWKDNHTEVWKKIKDYSFNWCKTFSIPHDVSL
jgi:23S rRNA U2552 (ribose-2'-O)-methylase RlmE/FtsJ